MLVFENKNKPKLYQNILRLLSKVIQTGFFSSIEKISWSFIVLVRNS